MRNTDFSVKKRQNENAQKKKWTNRLISSWIDKIEQLEHYYEEPHVDRLQEEEEAIPTTAAALIALVIVMHQAEEIGAQNLLKTQEMQEEEEEVPEEVDEHRPTKTRWGEAGRQPEQVPRNSNLSNPQIKIGLPSCNGALIIINWQNYPTWAYPNSTGKKKNFQPGGKCL